MANKYYTVKKGDTLSKIASKHHTTVKKLQQLNDIKNVNHIYVGEKLLISGSKPSKKNNSKSKNNNSSNKVTILKYGLQSNSDNTIFVTWKWNKDHTDNYRVIWYYSTGDGVSFVGSDGTVTTKQSTYNMPSNAKKVYVKIKPISKKHKVNKKEVNYWNANWRASKWYSKKSNPPSTPSSPPSVEIKNYKLTAELDNQNLNATGIQFQIVQNDKKVFRNGFVKLKKSHAAYSCNVTAGSEYKVRCRSYKGNLPTSITNASSTGKVFTSAINAAIKAATVEYSDWTDYSNAEGTIPSTPSGITTIKATSSSSVYIAWKSVKNTKTYELEYATKKSYLGAPDNSSTIPGITTTHYEKIGLESGETYYFRVRAINDKGESKWSGIKSVIVGKKPAPPTTWSSSTKVKIGDPLNLYWVHNSQDGSSQTYAQLETTINGVTSTETIKNTTDEDLKDKTSVKTIDTSSFTDDAKFLWRVRTRGVLNTYSDWSIQRTVDIYAPPVLSINVTDRDGGLLDTVETFPFYIRGYYGPNTQTPIGYHVTIQSLSDYTTVDNTGLEKIVKINDTIYDKYFDTNDNLAIELTPSSIDLEDGVDYEVHVIVSMDSGLTAEDSCLFSVSWEDKEYAPTASISVDPNILTATISPYCLNSQIVYKAVSLVGGVYTMTDETVEIVGDGVGVDNTLTDQGDQVFSGTKADGSTVLYCEYEGDPVPVEGISLSVYRREFDGTFTEIGTDLDNYTNVTDPHPSLDLARYRIVAIDKATGAISYTDPPGEPIPEPFVPAIVIQWDEDWSEFDVTADEQDELADPPWNGSMLQLPYNVDVSPSYNPDVSHIEYIGREHPVSYYGTQKGETATWNTDISKEDEDTLYALRRLAIYRGDVYVREPSGSGYWATVKVSFNQTHNATTIPVTLNITRVEGGM